MTSAEWERVRCPRAAASSASLPGGSGIIPPALRPACEVLTGLGQAKVGNTGADRVPGSMAWAAPWAT